METFFNTTHLGHPPVIGDQGLFEICIIKDVERVINMKKRECGRTLLFYASGYLNRMLASCAGIVVQKAVILHTGFAAISFEICLQIFNNIFM